MSTLPTSPRLTPLQRATLKIIADGKVTNMRFGYGAWRIVGAPPTVVGRLISLRLAKWAAAVGGEAQCEITTAGIDIVKGAE